MDIHVRVRYSLILFCSFLFFIPPVSRVITLLKIFAVFALFYFLPGLFLMRRFLDKFSLVSSAVSAVLVGMCFHIVYIYFLSMLKISFTIPVLLIPGVIFSVLADYSRITLPKNNPKELYLILAGIAFFLLTFNLAPGEDANGHLNAVEMILYENRVPATYPLYPEVSLSYHMGFHIIVSELMYITGLKSLLFLMSSLFCVFMIFTSYLCVKSLHDERAGFISGVLIIFGVLTPLYYLSYGAYSSLVFLALVPLVIFLLCHDLDIPLFSLVLAAGFMSHSAFLLIWIPLFVFTEKYRMLVLSCGMSLILSLPHLVRIQPSYSLPEIVQLYQLWFLPESFRVQMIAERIGVLVFVCGVLGFVFVKKREFIFFSVWLLSLLFLALTSLLAVEFPFKFVFFANRLIEFMVLPLTFLASIFVSEIGKNKYWILILMFVLPLFPHFSSAPRSSDGPLFPTDSPEFSADQEGILWLLENTDESAVVLNEWWTGTGSSWITSLGERRLIFPFLYVHDHFLDNLQINERSRDVFWICEAPDSDESFRLLEKWRVDYIFLSSYVEDRIQWRRDLWDVNQMIRSPNYELVFQKENTYIFRVRKENLHLTQFFTIQTIPEFNLRGIEINESFPLKKLISIAYEDSFTGIVQFWSDRGLVAEVPLMNTGRIVTIVLPFDPSLRMESSQSLEITFSSVVTDLSGLKLNNMCLSPDWIPGEYLALRKKGYIHVFGTETLEIVYRDTSPGNIDFNVFIDGIWVPLEILERKGDGSTKKVIIQLPGSYSFSKIGIHVHGLPFYVLSMTSGNSLPHNFI